MEPAPAAPSPFVMVVEVVDIAAMPMTVLGDRERRAKRHGNGKRCAELSEPVFEDHDLSG
jgi:hypothetical protein